MAVQRPVSATSAASATSSTLRYRGHLDDGLGWHLTVCGADPAAVGPVDSRARAFVVKRVVVDGCLVVTIDLLAAAAALGDRNSAVRHADDVVSASPDVWLWTTSPPRPGVFSFDADDGLDVAVPFPRRDGGGYDVEVSTWQWLSSATFGRIAVRDVVVDARARLHVVTLPGALAMSADDVDAWLVTAAKTAALGSAQRGFPFPDTLVVVAPVAGDDVPFGMVCRGGGPQAMLLLGTAATLDDVVAGWVAVHELSHLLAPPVGLDEAWLGEGLATYHQTVLRARAGLLTSTAAWQAIVDGVNRGASSTSGALSLREASSVMRSEGRWLQIYQGGAAVVLAVDVALRGCGSSIDAVVAELRAQQPRADARRLRAADVIARAASVDGCAGITATVDAALARPFPDVDALLRDLGVEGGTVQPTAPLAAIREAIMRPARQK